MNIVWHSGNYYSLLMQKHTPAFHSTKSCWRRSLNTVQAIGLRWKSWMERLPFPARPLVALLAKNVHVGSLGDIVACPIDVAPDLQVTPWRRLQKSICYLRVVYWRLCASLNANFNSAMMQLKFGNTYIADNVLTQPYMYLFNKYLPGHWWTANDRYTWRVGNRVANAMCGDLPQRRQHWPDYDL